MADEKRYVFVPLSYDNRDRAVEGELVLDKTTGDVWTRTPQGKLVSRTGDLDSRILEIIQDNIGATAFAFNNNKRVYRLYFEDSIVRLDKNMNLPKSFAYFRVRDIADEGRYYVNELTNVNFDATSIYPFENNETYFVEFYNLQREMVSQMIFSAKFAPTVLSGGDPSKIINRIEIHTNKDMLYVTESVASFLVRVFAVYEDASSRDITDEAALILNNEVETNTAGTKTISATYFYDTTNGQYLEDTKEIAVVEDVYATITDLVVVPRKIVNLNDGSRSIRLTIVAYFDDGTVRDVTDEVITSNNFDESLFNTPQYLTVKFNAGHLNTIEKQYTLLVKDDGSASDKNILYRDGIMSIDKTLKLDPLFKYFKVRDAQKLDFYYTVGFNEIGFDAAYQEKDSLLDQVHTGTNLIVEFFDAQKQLLDSDVFTAKYKEIV